MKFADARKLLKWAEVWHAPTYPADLAASLSVERTPYYVPPKSLRSALTAFRHLTQAARVRMAERYMAGDPL